MCQMLLFSEREHTFTFAIMLSSVSLSPVCRLSSVTFVHPTQPVEIFGNFSLPLFWYLGHPLTFTETFTEIVPGEPSVGGLNARGVAKYSDV